MRELATKLVKDCKAMSIDIALIVNIDNTQDHAP